MTAILAALCSLPLASLCLGGDPYRLSLNPVRGEAGAGRGETFRAADMIPLAVMHDRVQPAGLFGPGVEDVQRKTPFEVAIEQPAVQQLDAAEDKGRHLALGAPARGAQGIEKIVAAAGIADRAGGALQ